MLHKWTNRWSEEKYPSKSGILEVVPVKGIEPSTFSLQVSCSTN